MTETDALSALRSVAAELDENEKLAAAGILSLDCADDFLWSVFQENEPLSKNLARIAQLSNQFSKSQKIAFAIELLQSYQEDEDNDELWGPQEDPSITRAIAEVNAYTEMNSYQDKEA